MNNIDTLKECLKVIIKEMSINKSLVEKLRDYDENYEKTVQDDDDYEDFITKYEKSYLPGIYEIINSFNLKIIGEGVSRVVYQIDNDTVLKLEYNPELNQNSNESDTKISTVLRNYAPKIYEISDFGASWMIVEKCRQLKNIKDTEEWFSKIGIPEEISIKYKYSILRWSEEISNNYYNKIEPSNELEGRLFEIYELYYVSLDDYTSENVGFGSDGRPVILDYGYQG